MGCKSTSISKKISACNPIGWVRCIGARIRPYAEMKVKRWGMLLNLLKDDEDEDNENDEED